MKCVSLPCSLRSESSQKCYEFIQLHVFVLLMFVGEHELEPTRVLVKLSCFVLPSL